MHATQLLINETVAGLDKLTMAELSKVQADFRGKSRATKTLTAHERQMYSDAKVVVTREVMKRNGSDALPEGGYLGAVPPDRRTDEERQSDADAVANTKSSRLTAAKARHAKRTEEMQDLHDHQVEELVTIGWSKEDALKRIDAEFAQAMPAPPSEGDGDDD